MHTPEPHKGIQTEPKITEQNPGLLAFQHPSIQRHVDESARVEKLAPGLFPATLGSLAFFDVQGIVAFPAIIPGHAVEIAP